MSPLIGFHARRFPTQMSVELGVNQYTVDSDTSLSTRKNRATRASVHPDTQRMADAIYDYGAPPALIERVRSGVLAVKDACQATSAARAGRRLQGGRPQITESGPCAGRRG